MNISQYFERKTRDNGEAFYSLTDEHPDWLHDAVMEAHDGELPNDWRYNTLHSIASMIDDGEDDGHVIADSLVDIYTSDLLNWLAGHIERTSYVDSALTDFAPDGEPSTEGLIRLGQYLAIEQMAGVLIEAVQANADGAES